MMKPLFATPEKALQFYQAQARSLETSTGKTLQELFVEAEQAPQWSEHQETVVNLYQKISMFKTLTQSKNR